MSERSVVTQAYKFALDLTPAQTSSALSHVGGKRFVYNHMLAAVKANLSQREAERSYGIVDADLTPSLNWSAYGLRATWNIRKHTTAPWWDANSKEAYSSACASLSSALKNWSSSRKGARAGPNMGFPRFKKARGRQSVTFTTGTIRVEPDRHHVTLPRLGTLKTHESTRKLARRLEAGTARITTATLSVEAGRWYVSFVAHVERSLTAPAHTPRRANIVGIDLGVKDFLVVATPDGREVERIAAPREYRRAQRKLRALQRKAARQTGPYDPATKTRRDASTGWRETQRLIAKAHARVAFIRKDRIHKTTTRLAQTHQVIGVETLAVKAMMANGGARKKGLNRAIADAGFGETLRQLDYKTDWYDARLVRADRWYPSSKTCSACGTVKTKLSLRERTYTCHECGLVIDRDLNAAINLARLAQAATEEQPLSESASLGGADQKTTPRVADGNETETPPGSAAPQGTAA